MVTVGADPLEPCFPVVGIFARLPTAGRTKTRLAAAIGDELAARLAAAFLLDTLDHAKALPDVRVVLAGMPDDDESRAAFAALAGPGVEFWPQPDGDLGGRLSAFFDAFLPISSRVVVIGADSPSLPPAIVQSAMDRLRRSDVMLGPAADGGFYLLGSRAPLTCLTDGIEWGTANVLAQTAGRMTELKLSLHFLPGWYDVDTQADLARLIQELHSAANSGRSSPAPHTEQALKETGLLTSDL